jgi:AAHS family 4-hydroxybenzoate transporter-like MFS transporter
MGALFAASAAGLTVGAFLSGPLADKIGRKFVLMAAVALFGGFTLLSVAFRDLTALTLLRFLAGVGMGGAGPSAMALIAEMCPSDRRSSQLAWLGCGIPIGGGIAGFVATRLIPTHGWTSMFMVGGALPLLLLIVIAIRVPDSVGFLLLHHAGQAKVRRIMSKIAPEADFGTTDFSLRNEVESKVPVVGLFKDGLAGSTLLLWLAAFCTLMVVFFLTNWLPILLHATNYSLGQTSLILSLFLIGSPCGSLTVGFLMDRYNRQRCMVVSAFIAAACMVVIGNVVNDFVATAVVMVLAGASCGACVTGSSILAGFMYPTATRATGIGWTAGFGRLGSVFGTLSSSALLATGMAVPVLLKVASVPLFIACASFVALTFAARKLAMKMLSVTATASN